MAITKILDKKEAIAMAEGFLELLGSYGNQSVKPSASELGQYLASTFQMHSNGNTVCRNLNDYMIRMEKAQKVFSNFSFSALLEEPVICENRCAIRYDVNFTKTGGGKGQLQTLAILTIDNGKISKVTQVVHEKGTGVWDA